MLKQEGFLPVTNTVTFTVIKAVEPVAATLQLRIPSWVAGAIEVTVNGQSQPMNAKADSYLPLTRTWNTGDVVTLTMPAALRIEHAKDQASMIAIFYGPVLLAGELGSANMPNDVATSQDAYKSVAPATVPNIVNPSSAPSLG